MPQVIFAHGDPVMADYTPSAVNDNGDVLVLGAGVTCGVSHQELAIGILGAVAVGGGVYEGISLENNANFVKVYWNNTSKKFTNVSAGNAMFGYIVSGGGAGANTIVRVLHKPYV